MKRFLLLLFVGLSLTAYGQSLPDWTEEAWRDRYYPADQWYTGFVRERLLSGEDAGRMLRALEVSARNQLAESIIIKIEGNTTVEDRSIQQQVGGNRSEAISTQYLQAVRTATSATAVRMEVKSYRDPSTGMLYAFAAARRSDLAAFYRQQINVDLNKVESTLSVSEQLVAAGKKMQARRQCAQAQQTLSGITSYQDLLTAVDAGSDEYALQMERTNGLRRTIAQQLIDLEQSTLVYLDCTYEFKGYKDDAFNSDPGIFRDIIAQALSENGCSITDEKAGADYELTLTTSTTCRSDGKDRYGIISYYANVKGTLINLLTGKKLVDFSFLNDPDAYAAGKSPEAAATKAFKLPELRDKVLGKVLVKIKN
jgi:hypothetical protein